MLTHWILVTLAEHQGPASDFHFLPIRLMAISKHGQGLDATYYAGLRCVVTHMCVCVCLRGEERKIEGRESRVIPTECQSIRYFIAPRVFTPSQ